jgi:acetyl-CoA acetyltransferase
VTKGISCAAAIVGLGISEVGRVYGKTGPEFAADAVLNAVEDAGLKLADVDGVLMSIGIMPDHTLVSSSLGLTNQQLSGKFTFTTPGGASACAAIQYASMAIHSGMASTIVYVHYDCPLPSPELSISDVFGDNLARGSSGGKPGLTGIPGLNSAIGMSSANQMYALAARRHMLTYGTTSEHLGAIAVAQREWAVLNPIAQMRKPITIEDHQNSRWIAEPLHLLDCSLVSNGAAAFVITDAARAADLLQPPVYVWGWGQCHPGYTMATGCELGLRSGATISGQLAFKMAGLALGDIGVRELYDCYTFTVLITLEDYGFVEKGEGGPFVATGALAPGGSHPTNTGGGQLSAFYMWGATPLYESVVQARGHGGERQVADHDFVLCSGNGGTLDHHASLILGANPRS